MMVRSVPDFCVQNLGSKDRALPPLLRGQVKSNAKPWKTVMMFNDLFISRKALKDCILSLHMTADHAPGSKENQNRDSSALNSHLLHRSRRFTVHDSARTGVHFSSSSDSNPQTKLTVFQLSEASTVYRPSSSNICIHPILCHIPAF